MRYKKIFIMVLSLFVLLQINGGVNHNNINAKENSNIVTDLVLNNKKDKYYPGETIILEGLWELPNDSPNKEFKTGDQFKITIPEGIKPRFKNINLSNLGLGTVVGNEVIFEFNENIEGLVNRHGGFELKFEILTPTEDGVSEVELDFEGEQNTIIYKDVINVEKPGGVEGPSDEKLGKGVMSQTSSGIEWWIRVNTEGSINGSSITLEDNILDNHILNRDSFRVVVKIGSEHEDYPIDNFNITYFSDGSGFRINDLPIKDENNMPIFYTIYYETEYIGKEIEGTVILKNDLKAITKDGPLKPNTGGKDSTEGEFDLDSAGWGVGNKYMKISFLKVDSITKEPLAGAKFRLSHKIDESFVPIEFVTDENGMYEHPDFIRNGMYVLEEIVSPEGYSLLKEPMDIRIIYDENNPLGDNQVQIITIENNEEPYNIAVEKQWKNHKGEFIETQVPIAVSLLANGQKVRQSVITKDTNKVVFNNMPKKDSLGNIIKYTIEELPVKGFISSVVGDAKDGFLITNTQERLEPELFDIKVNKEWVGKALDKVSVNLLKDGLFYDQIELNEANDWQHTFEGLEKYSDEDNTKLITYNVEEVLVDGYDITISGDQNTGFTITNTEIVKPELFDIKVNKEWVGKVLDKVSVNLLKDGVFYEQIELNEANGWQHTFEGLEKYSDEDNTKLITYDVEEVLEDGYDVTISGDQNIGFTITNTEIVKPELFDIKVNKEWVGKPLDFVTIRLFADNQLVEEVDLSEMNEWSYIFSNLPKYSDLNKNKEVEYKVIEVENPGYRSQVKQVSEFEFTFVNHQITSSPEGPDNVEEKTPATGIYSDTHKHIGIVVVGLLLILLEVRRKRKLN